jgi:2-polyprenyl-6-methoxyphenol hydroxylase-like FAD-dependent oxidoreductase
MEQSAQVPLLVVGAGPAGLTSSLLLAHHGVPVRCIDKRTAVSTLPRARGVDAVFIHDAVAKLTSAKR